MQRTRDWQWAVAHVCDPADANGYVDACQLLDQLADETRLDELERLLDHDGFTAREAALTPYARLAGVPALSRMIQVLRRGRAEGLDNDGPAAVIGDLVEASAVEAAKVLIPLLYGHSADDRSDAAWLLGYATAAITADPLLGALDDPVPSVRANVAGSLAGFADDPRVIDVLVAHLDDADEQVRVDVASALGYLGDRRALPALRRMTADPAVRVREFAVAAIERIEKEMPA